MFDVGFWELVLVGVVALLVVGPERLPKLAYEVGLWVGRLQRYARNARFQIENELHNYEIKNSLQQPQQMLEDIKSEIDEAARDPWRSAHFSGELPGAGPAAGTDKAADERANAGGNPAGNDVSVRTESSSDDGKSKPRT